MAAPWPWPATPRSRRVVPRSPPAAYGTRRAFQGTFPSRFRAGLWQVLGCLVAVGFSGFGKLWACFPSPPPPGERPTAGAAAAAPNVLRILPAALAPKLAGTSGQFKKRTKQLLSQHWYLGSLPESRDPVGLGRSLGSGRSQGFPAGCSWCSGGGSHKPLSEPLSCSSQLKPFCDPPLSHRACGAEVSLALHHK